MASTRASAHAEVVCTALQNGEAVLLHLGSARYYTLNVTGARIWQLLTRGLTVEQVGLALEDEFDVGGDDARRAVLDLAGELAAENLVRVSDAGLAPAPPSV